MKIEFIKGFKDLTGKVHHITRAKRHWWSSWVISIDGRSPYDYRIDKDGKFKQVLHKFPGVTIHITKKGEISIKKDDPIPELESFDRCRTCSHLWGCRLPHPLGWEECRAYSDERFFNLFTP